MKDKWPQTNSNKVIFILINILSLVLPLQNLYSTYSLTPYNFLIPPTQNIITFGIYKIPLVRKSLVISYFYIFGSPCAMNWIFNLTFMHFLSISPPTRGVGGPSFFGIKSEFDLLEWPLFVTSQSASFPYPGENVNLPKSLLPGLISSYIYWLVPDFFRHKNKKMKISVF